MDSFPHEAIAVLSAADVVNEAGELEQAFEEYKLGLRVLLFWIRLEPNRESAAHVNARYLMGQYLTRAEELKEVLNAAHKQDIDSIKRLESLINDPIKSECHVTQLPPLPANGEQRSTCG
jgi:hypothetical protein